MEGKESRLLLPTTDVPSPVTVPIQRVLIRQGPGAVPLNASLTKMHLSASFGEFGALGNR